LAIVAPILETASAGEILNAIRSAAALSRGRVVFAPAACRQAKLKEKRWRAKPQSRQDAEESKRRDEERFGKSEAEFNALPPICRRSNFYFHRVLAALRLCALFLSDPNRARPVMSLR
jgi:hypothetical protein